MSETGWVIERLIGEPQQTWEPLFPVPFRTKEEAEVALAVIRPHHKGTYRVVPRTECQSE